MGFYVCGGLCPLEPFYRAAITLVIWSHRTVWMSWKIRMTAWICVALCKQKWSEVAQLRPTLCDPMDYSLPGSIHEIFQARILQWVAISFSRGSSQPRDRTRVSRIAGRRFTVWATREALLQTKRDKKKQQMELLPTFRTFPSCILSHWNLTGIPETHFSIPSSW